jgi:archaellum component FlaC
MTENRNNILTPLNRIREELERLENDPLRAFKMLQWLKENITTLQEWQEVIDNVTEQRHIKEMGVRDKTNSRPNIVHSINRNTKRT